MSEPATPENQRYKAVTNHEEQYSIWPASRENPLGWQDAGKEGTKEECLAWVKEHWTDVRPKSLRQRLAAKGKLADASPARS
jgi:MbtH protein